MHDTNPMVPVCGVKCVRCEEIIAHKCASDTGPLLLQDSKQSYHHAHQVLTLKMGNLLQIVEGLGGGLSDEIHIGSTSIYNTIMSP